MKQSIENLILLTERAEIVKLETNALKTAVDVVIGKKPLVINFEGVPAKFRNQYQNQVQEKIRLIKGPRRRQEPA